MVSVGHRVGYGRCIYCYSVQYGVCCLSVECAVYSVRCKVKSVQCVVCSVQCTVYSVQSTVCSVQCAVVCVSGEGPGVIVAGS